MIKRAMTSCSLETGILQAQLPILKLNLTLAFFFKSAIACQRRFIQEIQIRISHYSVETHVLLGLSTVKRNV